MPKRPVVWMDIETTMPLLRFWRSVPSNCTLQNCTGHVMVQNARLILAPPCGPTMTLVKKSGVLRKTSQTHGSWECDVGLHWRHVAMLVWSALWALLSYVRPVWGHGTSTSNSWNWQQNRNILNIVIRRSLTLLKKTQTKENIIDNLKSITLLNAGFEVLHRC